MSGSSKNLNYFHGELIPVNSQEHVAQSHEIMWNIEKIKEKFINIEKLLPYYVNSFHNYGISFDMVKNQFDEFSIFSKA